jgi:alpha-tubulin suppressor-like RCC1 family protein
MTLKRPNLISRRYFVKYLAMLAAGWASLRSKLALAQGYNMGAMWKKRVAAGGINASLWATGDNFDGQLGQGNTSSTLGPIPIGSLTTWLQVAAGGQHSLGVQTDGTLWTWGSNSMGQLGLPGTFLSPVQVGALTNWSGTISSKYDFNLAKKSNGTLWAWGNNSYGQLGQKDIVSRSSPIQVGSGTNWSKIAAGWFHGTAVTSAGALFSWGQGTSGELGRGTLTSTSSPTQVGTLSNWAATPSALANGMSFSCAIRGGSLFTWGLNDMGQLGLGDASLRSSPTIIGSLTTWSQVGCGTSHTLARRSDGTIWAWGRNQDGELGLGVGDWTNRSSPAQVGSLTNWATVFANGGQSLGIKTDGTLWAWGENIYGQLGLGNTSSRSSPTQVGSLTNWAEVAPGLYFSIFRRV